MTIQEDMRRLGEKARVAATALAKLSARRKNAILESMADEIAGRKPEILAANADDVKAGREAGLSAALIDRLALNDNRIEGMVKGIRAVVGLKDPVGARISRWIRPNGLVIQKVRVPIGVIAIIFESRPNVAADSSVLCLKTANAVILRGGKEALRSNKAIVAAMMAGGRRKGLPEDAVQLVETTDREAIRHLVQLEGLVDLAIPRGGEGLIRAVTEQARIPVIKHYKGICAVYIDDSANLDKAYDICLNAKCQRPGTCNAMETLLVSEKIAAAFLPEMARRFAEKKVEMRGDDAARAIAPALKPATEQDWHTEYLDLAVAIRVVPDAQAAIDHINRYGSHHSDAIVAESVVAQNLFTESVDSAAVYVNASTRFTDGGEFGMGAEIGISTDKLHARGPMGLEELTTYKFVVHGTGQIRE